MFFENLDLVFLKGIAEGLGLLGAIVFLCYVTRFYFRVLFKFLFK